MKRHIYIYRQFLINETPVFQLKDKKFKIFPILLTKGKRHRFLNTFFIHI